MHDWFSVYNLFLGEFFVRKQKQTKPSAANSGERAGQQINCAQNTSAHAHICVHTYSRIQAHVSIGAHLIEAIIENDKFEIYFGSANNTYTHIHLQKINSDCMCMCVQR